MNLHLAEIAKAVAPGAHAVLLVDQAGWHLSARLFIRKRDFLRTVTPALLTDGLRIEGGI
jgi:hypothetical protein